MSQSGRSGFLSYMLLLSHLLQFEHRSQQVAPSSGPGRESGGGRAPGAGGDGTSSLHSPRPLLQTNSSGWRGELSGPAATVLCLHGAQSNLSALQLAVL